MRLLTLACWHAARRCRLISRRALGVWLILLPCLGHAELGAQAVDSRQQSAATVTGVVYDSLAKAPLAGALVQIALATDLTAVRRTTIADSLGRYRLDSVPVGRYVIGFMHPMLDSLGIDPPLRALDVVDAQPVRFALGIPSPDRFAALICRRGATGSTDTHGSSPTADSSALVFGFVRNAHSLAAVANAKLTAQWLELRFGMHGFEQRVPRFTTVVRDNGWFAFCGVPAPTSLGLVAADSGDSTGTIEVEVRGPGAIRRDLFVGASEVSAAKDTTDTLSAIPRFIHVGRGTVSGIVVKSAGGGPIAGAHVSLDDGPQAVANDRGEWTINDAPGGTRMLTVRAVGYYPDHRAVDVLEPPANRAPRLVVSLPTLKAVLDTVKVTAQRLFNRDLTGFEQRRRTGMGYYYSSDDIDGMHLQTTTELFWRVPAVQIVQTSHLESKLVMRGTRGACEPAIFMDGVSVSSLTVDDIDAWVQPGNVEAIEVYRAGTAPMQYQTLNGCGAILIWTR